MLRSTSLRISCGLLAKYQRCSSTSNPSPIVDKLSEGVPESPSQEGVSTVSSSDPPASPASKTPDSGVSKKKSKLVSSAFASLQHNNYGPSRGPVDESIRLAKTPEDLLKLSENIILTKKQALKIVTTLSEWSLNGKSDSFESDPRFVSLCQLISKSGGSSRGGGGLGSTSPAASSSSSVKGGDLSLVLGVMGEDEAANMINSITLPQMIKVLSSLSFKRRRSLALLKALSFNISRSPVKLDIKQAADILYALASLNFPDEVLLEKVCGDLLETVPLCQKSAVIGSISTSLGLLRYKDIELLDSLCSWAVANRALSRPQDFVSLLLCLASVSQTPSHQELISVILTTVSESELPSASTWLDVVWSLAVLESLPSHLLGSVLSQRFLSRLNTSSRSSSVSWKRKLLNMNGLAKLTKDYNGPFLPEESNLEVPFGRSKDRELLYSSLIDTLSNLFPSTNHFRSSVDTGMGFLIDAECMFDAKLNPVPLIDKKTGQPIQQANGKKIALLLHDYQDCTRGRIGPSGSAALASRLLGLAGYRVIALLYTDYNPQAKLMERAKYLDGLLKAAATSSSTPL